MSFHDKFISDDPFSRKIPPASTGVVRRLHTKCMAGQGEAAPMDSHVAPGEQTAHRKSGEIAAVEVT
jgi:hypothetical protein